MQSLWLAASVVACTGANQHCLVCYDAKSTSEMGQTGQIQGEQIWSASPPIADLASTTQRVANGPSKDFRTATKSARFFHNTSSGREARFPVSRKGRNFIQELSVGRAEVPLLRRSRDAVGGYSTQFFDLSVHVNSQRECTIAHATFKNEGGIQ
jgi:hypothetical protein